MGTGLGVLTAAVIAASAHGEVVCSVAGAGIWSRNCATRFADGALTVEWDRDRMREWCGFGMPLREDGGSVDLKGARAGGHLRLNLAGAGVRDLTVELEDVHGRTFAFGFPGWEADVSTDGVVRIPLRSFVGHGDWSRVRGLRIGTFDRPDIAPVRIELRLPAGILAAGDLVLSRTPLTWKRTALVVRNERWGVTTRFIGANEGNDLFRIGDLKECGINTWRIYGDRARFEPAGGDGGYGARSIEEIRKDPRVVPWKKWDRRMGSTGPENARVSWREVFRDLKEASIRPVVSLRNRGTIWTPDRGPVPGGDGAREEDWSGWWEYVFSFVYWLNVRNDFGVDDFEVPNEPREPGGRGWIGTVEEYLEVVRRTRDAIDHVYTAWLPGRTCRLYAPGTGGDWAREALDKAGDRLDGISVHLYGSDFPDRDVPSLHVLVKGAGREDCPIWNTEWGTRDRSYEDVDVALDVLASMILGCRPGRYYLHGSHLWRFYDWDGRGGIVHADREPSLTYHAFRMGVRALQGGRPTHETRAFSPHLVAITTSAGGGYDLLVVNPSAFPHQIEADVSALVDRAAVRVLLFNKGSLGAEVPAGHVSDGKCRLVVPEKSAIQARFTPG